jgi:hypothetical protein
LPPARRAGFAGAALGLAFRGRPFPALGELDVCAFGTAGFVADAFVDLDAVAAGTTERAGWPLEVGIAASTVDVDRGPIARFGRRHISLGAFDVATHTQRISFGQPLTAHVH